MWSNRISNRLYVVYKGEELEKKKIQATERVEQTAVKTDFKEKIRSFALHKFSSEAFINIQIEMPRGNWVQKEDKELGMLLKAKLLAKITRKLNACREKQKVHGNDPGHSSV